ncbi:MAG: carboxymuconolactone decarboxylase family protein [Acidimicrobiales bacterium]
MTPRVELLTEDEAPLLARPFYADGDPGPITASLAQVPELAEVALPFLGAALGPSSIPLRAKELVILRTSALLRCRYCVASHTTVALDASLTRAEVEALRDERPVDDAFTDPKELALLAWTDAVATGHGSVRDEVADRLADHWPDHHVIELTVLVGATMLLNRYCSALGLPPAEETIARLVAADYALELPEPAEEAP